MKSHRITFSRGPAPRRAIRSARVLFAAVCTAVFFAAAAPVSAQLFDPQSSMIIGVLREISAKHQLGLQQQRIQTAKLVEQLKQFYDTYTLLRQDFDFTQSLYRDFQAVQNLQTNTLFGTTNFILNADRLDYWFPNTSQELGQTIMDSDNLLNNFEALNRTYDSFSVAAGAEAPPKDAELRRLNALMGEEAYSKMLYQHALRSKHMAFTYDSLATQLYNQVINDRNKFTEAERTNLLVESAKLRNMSNNYYEKYLELSKQARKDELGMYDEKMGLLRSKVNWKILRKQANKESKIRYGFFDITPAKID